jgi:UPF0042 nucleotide-binding protein
MKFTPTRPDALIVTRGFLHPLPDGLPPVDLVLDLRRILADPAHRPEGDMLDMNGLQREVRDFVLATPGAEALLAGAVPLLSAVATARFVVVMVGCSGGKHRAPAIGAELGARLRAEGLVVPVRHLHVHLPRVVRPTELAA